MHRQSMLHNTPPTSQSPFSIMGEQSPRTKATSGSRSIAISDCSHAKENLYETDRLPADLFCSARFSTFRFRSRSNRSGRCSRPPTVFRLESGTRTERELKGGGVHVYSLQSKEDQFCNV